VNLDRDLRRAFTRKPVPPGFADRVLEHLGQPQSLPVATRSGPRRRAALQWLTAAAALMVLSIGGGRYYIRQRTVVEAERVQNEVRLALRLAGEKLALVQRRLQEPHR
jgi:hypothetical protein